MAQATTRALLKPLLLLSRANTGGIGAVMEVPEAELLGYRRIVGYFASDAAPAALSPSVRLGGSALAVGPIFDETILIPQDFTQLPTLYFPFNILLDRGQWVDLNYTVGGVAGTYVRGYALALPE